ncbi:unnamed protein product [Clonostachys solani]|uniref:FAD-binding PCMH-type domain-containing protein n=1 Tax=Clonostachys solani TaxID=160281 RepID=A0A9N9W8U1_9HYPO|nr:unnamed protein product [Clonostachys solani]
MYPSYRQISKAPRTLFRTMPLHVGPPSDFIQPCSKIRLNQAPYSARPSVEGIFPSPYGGIVFNLLLSFHPDDMAVIVQSGVDLNKVTKTEGLFLPLDPSPKATIGGMVSTNSSGINAFRYGTMKDWIINVTTVLADGQVIKTRKRPRKGSASYNLTSLVMGSKGTLGIWTKVTLKLVVIPKETSVALTNFSSIPRLYLLPIS